MPIHHRIGLPRATTFVAQLPEGHPVTASPLAQWKEVGRICASHVKGFDW